MNKIKIAKLFKDAILPTRKHPNDAGMDIYSYPNYKNTDEYRLPPNESRIVRTGITISIPTGYVGILKPKSRSQWLVGAGVVDSDYQGEILVRLVNTLSDWFVIKPYTAIAQLLILPIETPEIVETSLETVHLVKTERGATGGILSESIYKEAISSVSLDKGTYGTRSESVE